MTILALIAVGCAIFSFGFAVGAYYVAGKHEQRRQDQMEMREAAFAQRRKGWGDAA